MGRGNRYVVLATLFHVVACSSFKSAHERFKDWANQEVALNTTVDKLDYNPNYPLGRYFADSHHLTSKEMRSDGSWVYHYARFTLFNKKNLCHYHLIIDAATRVVIGWGFDEDLGDPKKACGVAG